MTDAEAQRELLIGLAFQPDPALPEWRTWRAKVGTLAMRLRLADKAPAAEVPDQAMRAYAVEAIEIAMGVLKREGLGDQAERLAKVAEWLAA